MLPEMLHDPSNIHPDGYIDIRSYDFFKQLTELAYVEAIYLYGSRARGDYTPDSDVDIAISCPQATDEQWQHIEHIIYNSKLLAKLDVRRLDKMPSNFPFYKVIHNTKMLLYYRTGMTRLNVLKTALDVYEYSLGELEKPLAELLHLNSEEQESYLKNFYNKLDQLIRQKLRITLMVSGIRENAPVHMLRQAVNIGWITDRLLWEELFEVWEYTREPLAAELRREILAQMPRYIAAMRSLYETLKRIENETRNFYEFNQQIGGSI